MIKNIFVLLLFTPSLMAQNLLTNPNFDQGITDWNINNSNDVTWVADDGVSNNGSLQISDTFNNGGIGSAVHVAVAVSDQKSYEIKGSFKIIPNTEAQDGVIYINWLDENEMFTGVTDYFYSSTGFVEGQWTQISDTVTPPPGMHYASVSIGVKTNNSGSTDPAVIRWDDMRLAEANSPGFAIVSAHTGQWFNPDQNGHGLNVEILPDGKALVIWYTYDINGNQIWILGTGTHDGQTIIVDVNVTNGAMFPPAYDANDIRITAWGKFTLTFTDCNHGVFTWTPIAGNGYDAGQMSITRLTLIDGLECNE